MENKEVANFIIDQVEKNWKKNKQPLLLSSLGIVLNKNFPNKKPKEQSLKDWIDSYKISEIKYVFHKKQRAKIGLIPSMDNFLWDDISESSKKTIGLNDFVALMKDKLTEEEINKIPTSILLKLFA
ncbi:hypothetical protein [uncultured Haemophilus sp.]|uniref:hypothetical protein n=1 Tax=uncultured Haemophilus sp. TaxID=237779 RepID=UPI00258FF574|nr:hypothetical protein [uncultured Haemophilus sp.]